MLPFKADQSYALASSDGVCDLRLRVTLTPFGMEGVTFQSGLHLLSISNRFKKPSAQ